MAKKTDRRGRNVRGRRTGAQPERKDDVVGELLSIDELKMVSGGSPGCIRCVKCHVES